MSTPRTDAAFEKWQESWSRTPFGPDLARVLERELNAERETVRALRAEVARNQGVAQKTTAATKSTLEKTMKENT